MKSLSRTDKIIIIVAILFLMSFQIIIIDTPPAAGYEISLYKAYPFYLWLFILSAFSCGLYFLVSQSFSIHSSKKWVFGFIILLYCNLLILLLPFIRGYATLGRGDVLTHIGYIKDILNTGHFPSAGIIGANHYPVVHIIGADLSYLTNLAPEILAEIYPGFFTLFYICSIYLLARNISINQGEMLMITAFGSLLLFKHSNLMLAPSVICFFILPFNLFLIHKQYLSYKKLEFSLILILMLIVVPFLHPGEGTIFLFLIIFFIEISRLFYFILNRRINTHHLKVFTFPSSKIVTAELILIITWFAWFLSSSAFAGTIKVVWNWLKYEMGTTTAMDYTEIISKANLNFSQFTSLLFNMYGQALIYFIISTLIIIIYLKRILSRNDKISQMQFTCSLLFVFFGTFMAIAFISKIIWVEYNRVMIYVIFAATLLNGLGLYDIFHNKYRKVATICLIFVLIISSSYGLFNTFPSPHVRESNSQVTDMELTGMEHFFDHRDENLLIDNLGVNQMRFADCIYGIQKMQENIRYLETNPPDHFGYEKNERYGQYYINDRYLVESKLSRISYPEIFPEYKNLWRFTPEDFRYLDNSDTSVNRIYCNGEFWTYYVKSNKT